MLLLHSQILQCRSVLDELSPKTFTPLLAPTPFPLIDKWHKMFNINLHDIPGFIVVPVNCRGLPGLKHNRLSYTCVIIFCRFFVMANTS